MPERLIKEQPGVAAATAPKPAVEAESAGKQQLREAVRGKDFAEQEAIAAPVGGGAAVEVKGGDKPAAAPPPAAASTAPPLGAALVMTREPKFARQEYTGWYADQAAAKVAGWGLAPDKSAVRLASDGGVAVMALDWRPAWGSKPVTTEMDTNMRPLDAKAAVTGVHALPGWSKTPAADQPLLDGLLGGETNDVSFAGRNNLRAKFAGLAAETPEAQALTLTGILGAKESAPGVSNEKVETQAATYALVGPSTQKKYAFRGGAADAEVWEATYSDGAKLKIVAPQAPDPAYHHHTVEQAADAAAYLPSKNRASINTVVLNPVENPDDKTKWAVEYHDPDFHSYMTAGAAGVVTIYPDAKKDVPGDNVMRGSMIHETGHAWSYQTWGNDTTKGKWAEWKACGDKDKNRVSQYAGNAIAEDVAETVRVYGSTRGTPKYEEYRALVPNRWAMLEKELG